MTDTAQPIAGSLSAVVIRACREATCPHYLKLDCPEHARREDLGVVASFAPEEAQSRAAE